MQNSKISDKDDRPTFAMGMNNYRIMIAGIVVVVIGYLLMIGGGSADPNEFSEDLFSFRRITLAPIVVLLGYGLIFYAILTKKKDGTPE